MREKDALLTVTVVAFLLGAGFMLPFEYALTRLAGVISFTVLVSAGCCSSRIPAFLGSDGSED